MIWFCCLGVACGDPIFAKFGPKNGNFYRFWHFLKKTTGFQLKLLIIIESHDIFHWKQAKKSGCGLGAIPGSN